MIAIRGHKCMTRQEQIEQAAQDYGRANPNGHWNADAEYEEDYETPSQDFKAGAKWSDANPDIYSVTRKAVEREREHLINKACEFFKKSMWEHSFLSDETYVVDGEASSISEFIRNFKDYVEERQ